MVYGPLVPLSGMQLQVMEETCQCTYGCSSLMAQLKIYHGVKMLRFGSEVIGPQ